MSEPGLLVIDVGTSGVRAAVVCPDTSQESRTGSTDGTRRTSAGRAAVIGEVHHVAVLPSSPAPGFVEFDPIELRSAVLSTAAQALRGSGDVSGVGIANQRASTIVWDRATGDPVGPGIGWQDLRTVGTCLALQPQGIRLAPNVSATKLAMLLDMADPGRERDLCFGTIDTWVAWILSEGRLHVTDPTNAALTGLLTPDGARWDTAILEALRVPESVLPELVDSSGIAGAASALPGSPPICGIAGDQQASLVGQGCTLPGLAKATFGTGGMLDCCVGAERPPFSSRGPAGCYPVVAWRRNASTSWGVEAVMLSAGSCVEWLRDDLGIIESSADSDSIAASCKDTGDVWFVPALVGLGTPIWDFGARAAFIGITRGTGRAEIVRAVLEGIAHRGADLLEAAEADTGLEIPSLRVDGGMSANATFLQALADSTGKPVEVSPVLEATTLGAAYLAGMALGIWADPEEIAGIWSPREVVRPAVSPSGRSERRHRWMAARDKARGTIPELSTLEF